jgi:hypothetical protein
MEKKIEYKGYTVKIVPQAIKGDFTEVFFRIYRKTEDNTAFILKQKISGTSSREMTLDETYKYLVSLGISNIKRIIDQRKFIEGEELGYLE